MPYDGGVWLDPYVAPRLRPLPAGARIVKTTTFGQSIHIVGVDVDEYGEPLAELSGDHQPGEVPPDRPPTETAGEAEIGLSDPTRSFLGPR
ncbi:hypothetical protein GCM10009745_24460 [Kribbella yunnanensis]|uniref:Uncharacterized protein n=1 Tax=Kribbella yunnanensis TaxID=190194 RepID=A0ABP4SZC9_9ACTN